MKIASIDIGTNTMLLLIVEVDEQEHFILAENNFYSFPRIGKNVASGGNITPDALERLTCSLDELLKVCRRNEVEKTLLCGTHPFRAAVNTESIRLHIQKLYNLDLRVLSAFEEGYYSHLGVIYGMETAAAQAVIDVGGGSSEVTIGDMRGISFRKSIPVGAVNLTEKLIPEGTLPQRFLPETERALIRGSFGNTPPFDSAHAIAGTPTTLACLKFGLKEYDEQMINGATLSRSELAEFADELHGKSPEQVLRDYGTIMSGREDIIFMGTVLLENILVSLGAENVIVSSRGLRHGVMYDYLFKTFGRYFELRCLPGGQPAARK